MLKQVAAAGLMRAAGAARADSTPDTDPIIDKAIAALGGEAKLTAAKALSFKSKGSINFGGTDSEVATDAVIVGAGKASFGFSGDFGGNKMEGRTVLADGKGWRKFGDMMDDLKEDQLANEVRTTYIRVVPRMVLPLKGKEFKLKLAGEEKIDGKPAAGIAATGPDGKEFKIWFDKDTGLPAKSAAKVPGWMGDEYESVSSFTAYKDFDGLKVATKISTKRDGEKFIEEEVTEFKVLTEVPAKAFAKPE